MVLLIIILGALLALFIAYVFIPETDNDTVHEDEFHIDYLENKYNDDQKDK